MGREMLGAKVQALLPLSNRPSSWALAVPKLPVSAIRGKKAARAAATWAWAACSWITDCP